MNAMLEALEYDMFADGPHAEQVREAREDADVEAFYDSGESSWEAFYAARNNAVWTGHTVLMLVDPNAPF